MPNQRHKDKKQVGFYLTSKEREMLVSATKLLGLSTMTEFVRWAIQEAHQKKSRKTSYRNTKDFPTAKAAEKRPRLKKKKTKKRR